MLDKAHDHLESVHETYAQHMKFALWFAAQLIGAGVAVIIYALCPAFFQNSGSATVNKLHDILQQRKNHHHHHGG